MRLNQSSEKDLNIEQQDTEGTIKRNFTKQKTLQYKQKRLTINNLMQRLRTQTDEVGQDNKYLKISTLISETGLT